MNSALAIVVGHGENPAGEARAEKYAGPDGVCASRAKRRLHVAFVSNGEINGQGDDQRRGAVEQDLPLVGVIDEAHNQAGDAPEDARGEHEGDTFHVLAILNYMNWRNRHGGFSLPRFRVRKV